MVEELLPASVSLVAEVDTDEGVISRFDGFLDEVHACVARGASSFFYVAGGARANDVLPG
jgi:hypothetical protein